MIIHLFIRMQKKAVMAGSCSAKAGGATKQSPALNDTLNYFEIASSRLLHRNSGCSSK
jgi:hypothetical protein